MESSGLTPVEGATPSGDPVVAGTDAPATDAPQATNTAPAEGQTLEQQLETLLQGQRDARAEMNQLREDLDRTRTAGPTGPAPAVLDQESLRQQRIAELQESPFYCPGCGRTYGYQRECTGSAEAPHPPIDVISTDEFKNAPDPNTDPQGYRDWQAGHTPAPAS